MPLQDLLQHGRICYLLVGFPTTFRILSTWQSFLPCGRFYHVEDFYYVLSRRICHLVLFHSAIYSTGSEIKNSIYVLIEPVLIDADNKLRL